MEKNIYHFHGDYKPTNITGGYPLVVIKGAWGFMCDKHRYICVRICSTYVCTRTESFRSKAPMLLFCCFFGCFWLMYVQCFLCCLQAFVVHGFCFWLQWVCSLTINCCSLLINIFFWYDYHVLVWLIQTAISFFLDVEKWEIVTLNHYYLIVACCHITFWDIVSSLHWILSHYYFGTILHYILLLPYCTWIMHRHGNNIFSPNSLRQAIVKTRTLKTVIASLNTHMVNNCLCGWHHVGMDTYIYIYIYTH